MEYIPEKCVICRKFAQGVHFGVLTCRACAMFFRRFKSQINHPKWKCKMSEDYCSLENAEERLMCKYCRLQRCLEKGMNEKKPKPSETPQNRYDQRVIYDVIDPMTNKTSRWIDVAPIIKRSILILENHKLPEDAHFCSMSQLEKITFALEKLREKQSFTPKIVDSMSFRDFFYFWEQNMVRCAEWLMYCDEFRQLPRHEKIEIFKLVWAVWRKIERKTMSAQIFGQKCYDEKILILSDDVAARVDHLSMDISEIWNADFTKVSSFFGSGASQYYESLVKPYLEMKITETEVNFILSQVVWNYAGRRLQGQTQKAADTFLDRISNDLHDFYAKNSENGKNIDYRGNYAPRLAKIMQIVNAILVMQSKQEKLMDLVMLFDYFNVTLSDPSFFCV